MEKDSKNHNCTATKQKLSSAGMTSHGPAS